MSKEIIFTGPFKNILPQYIEYKRSLGYEYAYDYAKRLREMDNFLKKYNIKEIRLTKNMVINFVKKRDNEANSTICSRCAAIRGFAMFLKQLNYKDIYVLPNQYIPKKSTNFIPYIFTNEQIKTLTDFIDNYTFGSPYLNEHKIYSILFRVLYCCGLRISEALSLKVSDVDITNSIIHILKSKNNNSRIVYMSNSLSNSIKEYINDSVLSNNDFLFPTTNGKKYSYTTVGIHFRKFFKLCNIYTQFGKLPRIHDLRHTFSVHSLQKMINDGIDIYCTLPYLSSFLGHKNIYCTEKYVRLIETSFPKLLDKNSKEIFPEVMSDD